MAWHSIGTCSTALVCISVSTTAHSFLCCVRLHSTHTHVDLPPHSALAPHMMGPGIVKMWIACGAVARLRHHAAQYLGIMPGETNRGRACSAVGTFGAGWQQTMLGVKQFLNYVGPIASGVN